MKLFGDLADIGFAFFSWLLPVIICNLTCASVACITGALRAKLDERGLSREARGEGRVFFSAPRLAFREKMPRSPRLTHKAPVMRKLTFHGNLSLFSEVKSHCFSNKTVFHAIVGLARGANV